MPINRPTITMLLILAAGWGCLAAQDLTATIDSGVFPTSTGQARLEVYLEVPRTGLTYQQQGDRLQAHLAVVVFLKRGAQILDLRELQIDDILLHPDERRGPILRQVRFTPRPGTYQVLVALEGRGGRRFEETREVMIPARPAHEFQISTIQLSPRIYRSRTDNEFSKFGLTVWPHPSRTYGPRHPFLWYLAAVNGVMPRDTLEIEATLWQGSRRVRASGPRRMEATGLRFVDRGAFRIDSLAAGNYHLELTAVVGEDTVVSAQPFHVAQTAAATADSVDFWASLSSAEQVGFAETLGDVYPQLDIKRFRSADAGTRKSLAEAAAVALANLHGQDTSASLGRLVGNWRLALAFGPLLAGHRQPNDQGRMVFVYGLPDVLACYPATRNRRPYQVFAYLAADSTRPLVFIDGTGQGAYVLVHGALPGTPQNDRWRERLAWDRPVTEEPAPAPVVATPSPADTPEVSPPASDTTMVETTTIFPDSTILDTSIIDTTAVDTTTVVPDTNIFDASIIDSSAVAVPSMEPAPPDSLMDDTTGVQ